MSAPACGAFTGVNVIPVNYTNPSQYLLIYFFICRLVFKSALMHKELLMRILKALTDGGLQSHAQRLEFKDIQLAADGTFTEMLINVQGFKKEVLCYSRFFLLSTNPMKILKPTMYQAICQYFPTCLACLWLTAPSSLFALKT